MPGAANSHGGSKEGAFAQLLAVAKEHEEMCGQLLANARMFEGQLWALREEHEALQAEAHVLRGYLTRSRMMSGDGGDGDPEHCNQQSVTPSRARPNGGGGGGQQAAQTPGGTPRSSCFPQRNTGVSGLRAPQTSAPGRSSSGLGRFRARSQEEVQRHGPSLGASGSSANLRGRCESQGMLTSQAAPDSEEAWKTSRGREDPHNSVDSLSSVEPPLDVNDLVRQLLEQPPDAAEQQKTLRSLQKAIKQSVDAPDALRGPATPLGTVVKAGRADLARLLLRAKASANERDAKGVSALHLAVFDGNLDLSRTLIASRADVDACDRHGQTSLFFAPTRDICKLLMERRADVSVLNRKGQSALHLAGRAGLHEVLAWLTPRVNKSLVDLRDVHGATARNYAQQAGLPDQRPDMSESSANAPRGVQKGGKGDASQRPRSTLGTVDEGQETSTPSPSQCLPSVSQLLVEDPKASSQARPSSPSPSASSAPSPKSSVYRSAGPRAAFADRPSFEPRARQPDAQQGPLAPTLGAALQNRGDAVELRASAADACQGHVVDSAPPHPGTERDRRQAGRFLEDDEPPRTNQDQVGNAAVLEAAAAVATAAVGLAARHASATEMSSSTELATEAPGFAELSHTPAMSPPADGGIWAAKSESELAVDVQEDGNEAGQQPALPAEDPPQNVEYRIEDDLDEAW